MNDACKINDFFSIMYEQAPIAIEYYDLDGNMLLSNKSALELFGVESQDEIKDFNIFDNPNTTDELIEKIKSQKKFRKEITISFDKIKEHNLYKTSKSGIIYLDVTVVPFRNIDGNHNGYLVYLQDITETKNTTAKLEQKVREKTEEILQQKEQLYLQSKKVAMGDLVGIIAHQLKQPLNNLSLLKDNIVFDYKLKTMTSESIEYFNRKMTEQVKFMGESIDELKDFFRPNKKKTNYILEDIINKSISILHSDLTAKGVDINVDIKEHITINGQPNELQQVIMNLLSNAKDVFEEKAIPEPKIDISLSIEDRYAILVISDNGGGIPENVIDKIFDSYFTTKGEKGTGIGLNLTKMIVEESMNGKINVKNSNNGAVFTIKLPIKSKAL
jgi:PAS domain S-box-containing protein